MIDLAAIEKSIFKACESVQENYTEYGYEGFVIVYAVTSNHKYVYVLIYLSGSKVSPKDATKKSIEDIKTMDLDQYVYIGINIDDDITEEMEIHG